MQFFRTLAGLRPVSATALAVGISLSPTLAGAELQPHVKPNIVLILSDDEDLKIHAYMPKTKALLEDKGVVFENAFVTYSFCCPSRATILRGQYSHNTQGRAEDHAGRNPGGRLSRGIGANGFASRSRTPCSRIRPSVGVTDSSFPARPVLVRPPGQ
jgi:Sulfatase